MPMKQVRFFSLREDGYHYTGRILLGTEGVEFDGLPDHFQEQLRIRCCGMDKAETSDISERRHHIHGSRC